MRISLTCVCGQQQFVTAEMAGQSLACAGCGAALKVPAMGLPAESKANPKTATTPAETVSARWAIAFVAVVGLAVSGAVIWLLLANVQHHPQKPDEIVQNTGNEPGKKRVAEAPAERKRPEPVGLIEVAPAETKNPPKPVLERIKPTEPMQPVIDPIKPRPKSLPPVVVKKPPNVLEPIKLVWKLKADDMFFQELIVAQKPTFKIQGIPIAMALQYQIVSRFTVTKNNADGSRVVEQKIISAKLLMADDLTRPTIAGAIAQMPGTTYTLHLSPTMDVTKFEGALAGPNIGAPQLGGGMGLQMTSLLDRDGWKELAQATFFQMNEPLKANVNARWSKPMTHNWGGLGSWAGQIHYAYLGPQANLHKIGYGLQLQYKAPAGGKVGLMAVQGANFQPPEAAGMLLFDAVKGKVVAAEERFRVRGIINASLLGQNTPIEIDEDQHFLIRIHDKLAP